MKHIVLLDEYNEIDLKPSNLLQDYLRLTEQDVENLLIKDQVLTNRNCPGCHSDALATSFRKFGMRYIECANCHSLYVSPSPNDESLVKYYKYSTSRNYWRDNISKQTRQKRKEKIIKPRFEWIKESVEEYFPHATHIVDINTDQYGYIEEMVETSLFHRKTLLNPFLPLNDIDLSNRIQVVNTPMDDFAFEREIDVITIFEVADRKADVDNFFENIRRILKKNGLCFMTAILASGFDLQVLWDKADNIFPPDRLNVFSIEGLQRLFDRHDFECIELSTPGILDVEIVEKAIQQNPQIEIPRFIEYFLKNRNVETRKSFQDFLQMNLLSSYGRILLRKK